MPRWLPLASAALLAILVVIGLGFWKYDRLQEARISFAELRLAPATLAEMISLIEGGAISGKIGKQILPDLLEVWYVVLEGAGPTQ